MMKSIIAIEKAIYVFEKSTNSSTKSFVSITIPEPLGDANGDYCCTVKFDRQLTNPRKLIGVDPFHALVLAVNFLENLLSSTYADFEIQNSEGEKYTTPY